MLITLPYDGVSVDGNGNKIFIQVWLPANDSRVTINQVAPANWPPQENDLWIVPTVTPPAFVVGDGTGKLYFATAATIRQAYSSQGKPTLPPTTDVALATYGNKLVLLHRGVS